MSGAGGTGFLSAAYLPYLEPGRYLISMATQYSILSLCEPGHSSPLQSRSSLTPASFR